MIAAKVEALVTVTVHLDEGETFEVVGGVSHRGTKTVVIDTVTVALPRLRLSGRGYGLTRSGQRARVRTHVVTIQPSDLPPQLRAYVEGIYESAVADLPPQAEVA